MIQNYFFDLDGTLINSEPGIFKAHRASLEELGYQVGLDLIAKEGLAWTIGPPLTTTLPRLLGTDDPQKINHYLEHFNKHYTEHFYSDLVVYEGIAALLKRLHSAQKKIFVCTSKPERVSKKILEHLGFAQLLTGLKGAHEDERPHSKADFLRELLAQYPEIDVSESVMIGDRKFDMEAGRACNFTERIGVLYGFGSEEELRGHGATRIVSRAEEIFI